MAAGVSTRAAWSLSLHGWLRLTEATPVAAPNPTHDAGPRLRSLDGLRGVAALIVVVHHSMLMTPAFAATYFERSVPAQGSPLWWLTATPLKLFTAGGEAVLIFFVLSGFVLTLPVLRTRDYDWWDYYPRRILRLGLPVVGAVGFAAILLMLVPQDASSDFSLWINRHALAAPNAALVLGAIDLFSGDPAILHTVWSLKWEIFFSLLLPVFVLVALAARRFLIVLVPAAAVAVGVGLYLRDLALQFLPTFFGGVVLAVAYSYLSPRLAALNARRFAVFAWVGFFALSVCVLVCYWLNKGMGPSFGLPSPVLTGASLLGAIGIVVAAIWWPGFSRLLQWRPVRWLGKVSFSLYLLHVPIELTVVQFIGPELWYLAAVTTVILALVAAALFEHFVEAPAHRFSKRVGAWASRTAAELPSAS